MEQPVNSRYDDNRFPRRFMADEARNRRIGRPLQRSTGITVPDRALLERIGRALMERD